MRLLRMLAASHGTPWNASQIGASMGLDHKEINKYLDYLVGTFLIRRLEPYYVNIGKRLVKSHKVYWRDSGLLHSLLNVPDERSLFDQPWVGTSWEFFVIEQSISTLTAHGKHFNPYFFRTSDQHEIDLILDFGKELWAVEVKLSATPSNDEMIRLNRAADLVKATKRVLVCKSKEFIQGGNMVMCNLPSFLRLLVK
jgi:hypothetical protein